nr:MAG TPA: hypothetical protein [Caudoviricetes sp.]
MYNFDGLNTVPPVSNVVHYLLKCSYITNPYSIKR